MERLKKVKEALLCAVESQLGNLDRVDAKELGEVVDMVKDMEEAMYYCSVVKAMEEREKEEEEEFKEFKYRRNYGSNMMMPMTGYYPDRDYRDIDRDKGRMYYDGRGNSGNSMPNNPGGGSGTRNYQEPMGDRYPMEIRDVREGRSSISRKNYMESKELHKGAPEQMKELEKYLQELSHDITEMVADASPEEKAVLQQKLSLLASKIK